MNETRYCRVIDGRQKTEIEATRVIPTSSPLDRCYPYPAGTVAFLVDKSLPTAEDDIASYAKAKHEDFDEQEIWRVDFNAQGLRTERDKTKGALPSAIVGFGDVVVEDAEFKLIYTAKAQQHDGTGSKESTVKPENV